MPEIPQIQEKAPKPPGLIPKHVQTWLLVALAFLMIAIMWLTGGNKPQPPGKASATAPVQVPLEVNETKIAELQNRIQELQRQQLAAQNALEQQTQLLAAGRGAEPARPPAEAGSDRYPQDPVVAERKKRAYTSLFASNVALSYRSAPAPAPAGQIPASPSPENTEMAQLLKTIQPAAVPSVPIEPTTSNPPSLEKGSSGTKTVAHPALQDGATGKTYVLFEGTILETVLVNRLDGQFSGPIECLLSTDIYSHDRQHLLIPAGSKLLGQTKKVDTFGQTRLAVFFHRLLMPDGYSVSLDQFHGLNQVGDTGLRDEVNNHYMRIFGVSLAIGALGAVAEGGTAGSLNQSGADLMRQGFAASTAQSAAQILDKFLNILPTVTIREGHRVKVYLAGDLALPDYAHHTMPANL